MSANCVSTTLIISGGNLASLSLSERCAENVSSTIVNQGEDNKGALGALGVCVCVCVCVCVLEDKGVSLPYGDFIPVGSVCNLLSV